MPLINNNLIVGVPEAKRNYKTLSYASSYEQRAVNLAKTTIEYLLYSGVPEEQISLILLKALNLNSDTTYRELLKNKRTNVCSICGSKKNLTLHHLTPVNENKALKYRNSNLITVCRECHDHLH